MIWVHLVALWKTLCRWLIVPPAEDPALITPIDPNSPCPGCGHRKGQIAFGRIKVSGHDEQPMICHQCQVCGCRWGSEPAFVPKYPLAN